jgi:hypothetical protein
MRFALLAIALPLAANEATTILERNCYSCHSKSLQLSGLDLSSREAALKGGAKGPALNLTDPTQSNLLKAITHDKGLAPMPPANPLKPDQIAILESWIRAGATYPESSKPIQAPTWWSFIPPKEQSIKSIDHYLDSKLAEQKLPKAPRASRSTLIRPKAYEQLVDKLLASPRYGEKWARHWLDLVRYSDTAGFELDSYVADAWRYRDYVIQSFNEDKPYNRFIQEQLAGDEYAPEDPIANTGTGYFCVGPNRDLFPDQADINRVETLTDFTDTTASVFLGLTAGCARCHDHKFDPISQKDYYRLQAVFAPAVKTKVALNRLSSLGWDVDENIREIKLREIGAQIRAVQDPCQKKLYDQKLSRLTPEIQQAIQTPENDRTPRQKELQTEHNREVNVSDDEIRACLNPTETTKLNSLERQLITMFKGYREKPFACGVTDVGDFAPKTFVPSRGVSTNVEVTPGFFSALGGGDIPERSFERKTTGPIPMFPTTGRRHALAEWLTNPQHPLTARVMVNRIWQYHFGRGIVATPSDYGRRGAAPSHPELLDHLATQFVQNGWSVKRLHRAILLTDAYQRDANPATTEVKKRDPENIYLSHFNRRRLTADELRDSVLASTGRLNLKMFGRPVVTPLAKEEMYGMIGTPSSMWILTTDTTEHTRRSIYLQQRRTFRVPMMEVFDAPEPMLSCSRREASTIAPQSLTLLNGSLVLEQSKATAADWVKQHATDDTLIQQAWQQLLSRQPSPTETTKAKQFLATQTRNTNSREAAAAELARALLNLNEFLYVD